MLNALLLSGTLTLFGAGALPADSYTERGLCELWASAQCKAVHCGAKGKLKCAAESAKCAKRPAAQVEPAKALKIAECARALLAVDKCGAPKPSACNGVSGP